MTAIAPGRWEDLAGPIVVKEVRQGLRAKVFGICFGVLLAVCLVAALVVAAGGSLVYRTLGQSYLALFFAIQSVLYLFVIPLTAYRSMVREQEEETWVLLALTGVSGRQIALGKVSSSLVQFVLYGSCCAPFVLFSYYLNGVDLPTLAVGLALTFCASVFLVCGAVALGTEGATRFGQTFTQFVALVLLAGATYLAVTFGTYLAKEGSSWVDYSEFWVTMAALAFLLLSSAWVLLEAAGANLALASERNTVVVRRVIVAQHVIAQIAAYATCLCWKGSYLESLGILNVVSSLLLAITGFFLVSELDGFPCMPGFKVSWTTPGAFRGWRLLMALLFMDGLGWLGLYILADRSREVVLAMILAAPVYVGLYSSIAVVLGRVTPLSALGHKAGTRAAFVLAVVAAAVLSPLVALLAGQPIEDPAANVLNPFFGMSGFAAQWMDPRPRLLVLWICFAMVIPLAHRALAEHDQGRVG